MPIKRKRKVPLKKKRKIPSRRSGCPPGSPCSWASGGENTTCFPGSGDCEPVSKRRLLVAKRSKFHDQTLINATQAINEILTGIPEDPRELAFLHTKMGTLLAWVEHDVDVPDDAVTYDDDDDKVAAALGLIDWETR